MKNTKKMAYKTEWDFKDLYSGPNDPKIEKDAQEIEKAYKLFSDLYKDSDLYLHDVNELYNSLIDWEKLCEVAMTWKPGWYLSMILEKNTNDSKARAALNLLEHRLKIAANEILFFEIKLGTISKEKQYEFLNSKILERFKYYLERIFITSKYNLSANEEKILNLKSLPAYGMWVDAHAKLISSKMIVWKGKKIPLEKALSMINDLPTKERYALRTLTNDVCKEVSFLSEAELNAVCTNKKIDDGLRGVTKAYELTAIGYHNTVREVESLVETVTKSFKISHRFYKLKAKLLKLKSLRIADTSIGIGNIKTKFTFETSAKIIQESFKEVDPVFEHIFTKMLQKGRIDVFPKQHKRGGAFCNHGESVPTVVLLNHADNFKSFNTLAHEMGHAIHSELSRSQPILYRDYTISVAEVASTFFENIAFENVFEKLSDSEKKIALFDRVQDDMSTIFRQIAFFNFEKEMHELIRTKGSLTNEEFAKLYVKHLESYIGPAMKLTVDDGYSFVYVNHFRYFFYVYSYAFGQLISKSLYEKYKKDKSFIEKIKQFLSAGGSASPETIFKNIGIDVSDPAFFEAGLKSIEEDIKKLERLVK